MQQRLEWKDIYIKAADFDIPKNISGLDCAFINCFGGWIMLGTNQLKRCFNSEGVYDVKILDQCILGIYILINLKRSSLTCSFAMILGAIISSFFRCYHNKLSLFISDLYGVSSYVCIISTNLLRGTAISMIRVL